MRSRHGGVPCITNDTNIAANTMKSVGTCRKKLKPPDLPVEPEKWPTNDQDERTSCADMLNNMHGVAEHANTTGARKSSV